MFLDFPHFFIVVLEKPAKKAANNQPLRRFLCAIMAYCATVRSAKRRSDGHWIVRS